MKFNFQRWQSKFIFITETRMQIGFYATAMKWLLVFNIGPSVCHWFDNCVLWTRLDTLYTSYINDMSIFQWHKKQRMMDFTMLRNMQGLHAPLKLQMELNITGKVLYFKIAFFSRSFCLCIKSRSSNVVNSKSP